MFTLNKFQWRLAMLSVIALLVMSCGQGTTEAPQIYSFSPDNGAVGVTVTIFGTGFDQSGGNNIVMFNETKAVVSSVTNTNLVTTVPTGATTGKISVTVNGQTATSFADFTVN